MDRKDESMRDRVIEWAAQILEDRAKYRGEAVKGPKEAAKIACLRMGCLEHEVFSAFWLDAQNCLIKYDQLFRGTISQTSVYPREVVKEAIANNAAAVIFAHNHPSGSLQPSSADEALTDVLKKALALVDVKVIDHVVVSGNQSVSMAEMGMV